MKKSFVDDAGKIQQLVGVNPILASHQDEILDLLAKNRVVLEGHFSLQSERHSEYFLRFKQIGQNPEASRRLAQLLVEASDRLLPHDATILTPESAAFSLAKAVERIGNDTGKRVTLAVCKIDYRRRPTLELRSGQIVPDREVVIVSDAITSGSSLQTLLKLVENNGAKTKSALVFAALDPSAFTRVLNSRRIPGQWLLQAMWKTWQRDECPLCLNGAELPVPAFELN